MDTPLLDAKMTASDRLKHLFGKMTVHFSAKTTEWIKELLEEVLSTPEGVIVETKQLQLDSPSSIGQRETSYDNVGVALVWLLLSSRSRASTLREAFGFQVISYPDLDKGGLRLARLS